MSEHALEPDIERSDTFDSMLRISINVGSQRQQKHSSKNSSKVVLQIGLQADVAPDGTLSPSRTRVADIGDHGSAIV